MHCTFCLSHATVIVDCTAKIQLRRKQSHAHPISEKPGRAGIYEYMPTEGPDETLCLMQNSPSMFLKPETPRP